MALGNDIGYALQGQGTQSLGQRYAQEQGFKSATPEMSVQDRLAGIVATLNRSLYALDALQGVAQDDPGQPMPPQGLLSLAMLADNLSQVLEKRIGELQARLGNL